MGKRKETEGLQGLPLTTVALSVTEGRTAG